MTGSPPPLPDEMAQALGLIRQRFLQGLPAQVDLLDQAVTEIELGHSVEIALTRAGQETHRISGVAKTLGFPELGTLAREAEAQINTALAAPQNQSYRIDVIEKLDDTVAMMADILDATAG